MTNISEETSIDILCRCRVVRAEDCVMWMIFKKTTPTPTNILRMLAMCGVLKIKMLSSVASCFCKTQTCHLLSLIQAPFPSSCQKSGPQPIRQKQCYGQYRLKASNFGGDAIRWTAYAGLAGGFNRYTKQGWENDLHQRFTDSNTLLSSDACSVLKKIRYVASVSLEPATCVAWESRTFSLRVLEIWPTTFPTVALPWVYIWMLRGVGGQ